MRKIKSKVPPVSALAFWIGDKVKIVNFGLVGVVNTVGQDISGPCYIVEWVANGNISNKWFREQDLARA